MNCFSAEVREAALRKQRRKTIGALIERAHEVRLIRVVRLLLHVPGHQQRSFERGALTSNRFGEFFHELQRLQ